MLATTIRDYRDDWDRAFLIATWMRSGRHSPFARGVPTPIYYRRQRQRIEALLAASDTRTRIIVPQDTPELIIGWSCSSPNRLHWLYVKLNYRRHGYGRALFEDAAGATPHWYSSKGDVWIEARLQTDPQLRNMVYDPYWFENKEAT